MAKNSLNVELDKMFTREPSAKAFELTGRIIESEMASESNKNEEDGGDEGDETKDNFNIGYKKIKENQVQDSPFRKQYFVDAQSSDSDDGLDEDMI